jgi:hypothetical protein
MSLSDEYLTLMADAARYRFLRDHTGNKIMRKLMKECQPSRWDELIDKECKANVPQHRASHE